MLPSCSRMKIRQQKIGEHYPEATSKIEHPCCLLIFRPGFDPYSTIEMRVATWNMNLQRLVRTSTQKRSVLLDVLPKSGEAKQDLARVHTSPPRVDSSKGCLLDHQGKWSKNYPGPTPTRIFVYFVNFYGPFLGQEGF